MAREFRRKLHDAGYQGYRDYYVSEFIEPQSRRRAPGEAASKPPRAGIEPAAKAIALMAGIVLCIVVTIMVMIPLRWFVQ
jgi:hypothetical protein